MRLSALLVLAILLLTLPMRHAHAEPFLAASSFDQPMIAHVAAIGLAFMLPRTLQPIGPEQLSLWGLRGLSTLDSRLIPDLRESTLRLSLLSATAAPRLLLSRALPPPAAGDAWGEMIAALVAAAWEVSPAVRKAGTNGILTAFFDEIGNHLDPYSRYVPPSEVRAQGARRASIGADITDRRGRMVVAAVAAEGPAAKAGLRPGDVFLAIGGEALAGASENDVADRLAGPDGSPIMVRVRSRAGAVRDLTLVRAIQIPSTVRADIIGHLLVLRISAFVADTGRNVGQALASLREASGQRRRIRGVVLDLRGNPGGLLRESASVAEDFLSQGVIATTSGRDPAATHLYAAAGQDLTGGLPILVLVDGGSASAAEILAASLADQHRAVVIGSATIGKGVTQAVQPLPNGAQLVLSWSRVLAPLGWPIHGLGVLPQVCTSLGPDATQAQLVALDSGEQPMAEALSRHRAARSPVASAEALALRSACPAAEGRGDDLEAARFLSEHPRAYATALLGPA